MPKFEDTYRETCFNIWVQYGAPDSFLKTQEILPANENGDKPSIDTLRKWFEQDWKLRADNINSRALEIADEDLIQRKAEMLKEQAERGKKLQTMGIEYLEKENFDSSSSAVSAVINGAKLERESRGIGDLLVRMSQMSNSELQQEIVKRLKELQEDKENTVDAIVGETTDTESDSQEEA